MDGEGPLATAFWWLVVPAVVVGPPTALALSDTVWFWVLFLLLLYGCVVALVFTRDVRSENHAVTLDSQALVERQEGPDAIPNTPLGFLIRASTSVGLWALVGIVVAVNLR